MAADNFAEHSKSYVKVQKNLDSSLVNKLLSIASPQDKLIIQLITTTGATPKEITNLKRSDIHAYSLTYRVTKRTVSTTQKLAAKLQEQGNTYVFTTNKSPRLRERTIRKRFSTYSKKLNTTITASALRSFSLKNLLKNKGTVHTKKQFNIKRIDTKPFLTKSQTKSIITSIT